MGLNIGNIDPQTIQKLLFGGPQAAMFPQDQQQAPAPAPTPDASPRGSIAASMPQQAPPQEPPQTPAPAPEQSTTPQTTAASQPPQNAPIPQAPQPYKHGTLAKIMLGIGEAVGNPLATHIGERDRARQQEIDEYGRNLPVKQYEANVSQQKNMADLAHTQAQTHLEQIQAQLALQNLPLEEQAQKHYDHLLQTWQERATPDFDSYAHSYLAGLPDVIRRRLEPHLDQIKSAPQTGKGYKLNMQDDMPVSVESYGKTYQPDDKGGFGPEVPPQAVQEFTAAQKTHAKAQQGKVDVAKAEAAARQAILAGNFGQAGDPMIDMVGQGRVDLATALQRIPPQAKETFMAGLSAKYPGFNQANYGIAKGVGEAFTSGTQGQQLTAINTAREHMKTFSQLADALNNGDVQILNKIGNAIGVQFGSDKATNFKIAAQAFGGEVGKAFDGAGVTEGERKSAQNSFNEQMSKGQFKGAIQTVDALLAGKQRSLKQSYESGKEGKPNFGSEKQGSVIYARDPQGKLHQAPAGTALPQGWTQEKQ